MQSVLKLIQVILQCFHVFKPQCNCLLFSQCFPFNLFVADWIVFVASVVVLWFVLLCLCLWLFFVGSIFLLRSHLLSIMLVLSGGIQNVAIATLLVWDSFCQSFRACKTWWVLMSSFKICRQGYYRHVFEPKGMVESAFDADCYLQRRVCCCCCWPISWTLTGVIVLPRICSFHWKIENFDVFSIFIEILLCLFFQFFPSF